MSKAKLFNFFATLLIFSITFNDAIVFKFSNAVCKSYNESWVVFNKCRLKAISRDKIVLNVYTMVLYPSSSIDVRLKLWKRESGFKPFLLDSTVDACRFMKKAYNPFVGLVYTIFRDFSNLNHSCPYVGLQIVKDFYLRPELVRLPFPSGEYLLSMQWYFYKRIQFDINVTYIYLEDLLHRT